MVPLPPWGANSAALSGVVGPPTIARRKKRSARGSVEGNPFGWSDRETPVAEPHRGLLLIRYIRMKAENIAMEATIVQARETSFTGGLVVQGVGGGVQMAAYLIRVGEPAVWDPLIHWVDVGVGAVPAHHGADETNW